MRHSDRDFNRLMHNNFTEKLVRLQEDGYLSPFLLENFINNKYGRSFDERK